jgi:hypothetical protein
MKIAFEKSGKLSDISAFLDSYGIEIKRGEVTFCRMPVIMCRRGDFDEFPDPVDAWNATGSLLTFNLIRYEPFIEPESEEIAKTRWPFFVDFKLSVRFGIGVQVAEFDFEPGRLFEERENATGDHIQAS